MSRPSVLGMLVPACCAGDRSQAQYITSQDTYVGELAEVAAHAARLQSITRPLLLLIFSFVGNHHSSIALNHQSAAVSVKCIRARLALWADILMCCIDCLM